MLAGAYAGACAGAAVVLLLMSVPRSSLGATRPKDKRNDHLKAPRGKSEEAAGKELQGGGKQESSKFQQAARS